MLKDELMKDEVKSILIKFATKKYDTHGKTILCVFDSKQLKNVSEAISSHLDKEGDKLSPPLGYVKKDKFLIECAKKYLRRIRGEYVKKADIKLDEEKIVKEVNFVLALFYPSGDWVDNQYVERKSYRVCVEQIAHALALKAGELLKEEK